jgi:NAD(P)-dependent dehydrogenase (short-subunit alcohol dehydrogenase family)
MSAGASSELEPAGKGVVVTGASSGIGHAVALRLARAGFTVLGTVRREADEARLRELGEPNLVPVGPLDLSRREQIPIAVRRASDELARRGVPLFAVVNNAGGGATAPVELMDLDAFQLDLAARLVGPVALLQETLPMLREAKGRVLWIATPGLFPVPFVASIHACDFAANCLARTLGLELRRWGIPCILVRCGGIRTAAPARTDRELEEAMGRWPAERRALYAGAIGRVRRELADFDRRRSDPEVVAEVIQRALTARRPRQRYQVGYMSRAGAFLEALPQGLVDRIMAGRAGAV